MQTHITILIDNEYWNVRTLSLAATQHVCVRVHWVLEKLNWYAGTSPFSVSLPPTWIGLDACTQHETIFKPLASAKHREWAIVSYSMDWKPTQCFMWVFKFMGHCEFCCTTKRRRKCRGVFHLSRLWLIASLHMSWQITGCPVFLCFCPYHFS